MPKDVAPAAGDEPRPDLPRIELGEPLAGHWIKVDTTELRMSDFEAMDESQRLAGVNDPAVILSVMPKILRMLGHAIVATSLPGASVSEALGELRAAEFAAVMSGYGRVGEIPNAS